MKKIISVILIGMLLFSMGVSVHAFSDKSHMLNRVTSGDYETFLGDLMELVEEYDEDESFFSCIELPLDSYSFFVDGAMKSANNPSLMVTMTMYDATMIHSREIVEELGYNLEWNSEDESLIISGENKEVVVPNGENYIIVDGEERSIPVSARVDDGGFYVPARATLEALGCEVDWDNETQTIMVTRDFQAKRLIVKVNNGSFDFGAYGAVEVIWTPENDYAIVQFDCIDETKAAYESLKNNASVLSVEPDVVIANNQLSASNPLSDTWDTDYTNIVDFANTIDSTGTIKFAVVDSGVNPVGILSGKVESGVNCIGDGSAANDSLGHGTNVAGIVAKCMGNVGYKIIPIKITDTAAFTMTSSIFGTAIRSCIEKKADVINMSISIPYSSEYNYINDGIESALRSNIIVVVAAGNDNVDVVKTKSMLASRNDIIVVGSSNRQNGKSYSSSYGSSVDLSAPGENVMSIDRWGNEIYVDGCSFSTAHVSAAAGLLKAKNPSWTPAQIESELKKNVYTPAGWDTINWGEGILYLDEEPEFTGYEFSTDKINLTIGEEEKVSLYLVYSDGSKVVVTDGFALSSSDTSVVTVSNGGKVKAVGAGNAIITLALDSSSGVARSIALPHPINVTVAYDAASMIQLINSLGTVGNLATDDITLSLRVAIDDAKSAYEAMEEEEKTLVTNKYKLDVADQECSILENKKLLIEGYVATFNAEKAKIDYVTSDDDIETAFNAAKAAYDAAVAIADNTEEYGTKLSSLVITLKADMTALDAKVNAITDLRAKGAALVAAIDDICDCVDIRDYENLEGRLVAWAVDKETIEQMNGLFAKAGDAYNAYNAAVTACGTSYGEIPIENALYADYEADKAYYETASEVWTTFESDNSGVLEKGTDANGIKWYYYESGVLELKGTGDMANYSKTADIPWYSFRTEITEVIVNEGITGIGSRSFYNCVSLSKATIPAGVTSIGYRAFYNCDDVVIYGESGTYAETYANENDLKFVDTKAIELKELTVDFYEGTKKWFFDVNVEDYAESAMAYAAGYDAHGRCTEIVAVELELEDVTTMSLTKNSNMSYIRLFVWNENLQLVTKMYEISL